MRARLPDQVGQFERDSGSVFPATQQGGTTRASTGPSTASKTNSAPGARRCQKRHRLLDAGWHTHQHHHRRGAGSLSGEKLGSVEDEKNTRSKEGVKAGDPGFTLLLVGFHLHHVNVVVDDVASYDGLCRRNMEKR